MRRDDAASVLASAVTTARFLEVQANRLDGALMRLLRGEPLPPHELHALLTLQQESYRRIGGHMLLVAELLLREAEPPLPWWRRAWRRAAGWLQP